MNSDSDAEIDNETLIKIATFSNALHYSETVKTYLMHQDVNVTVFSSLHKVGEKKNFFEKRSYGLKILNERTWKLSFVLISKIRGCGLTATAGSDVVQCGRPIFDDFFQHLWPYIGNNTANVVFQMVKRLWLIRIDQ
ncbi:hypothetical protein TNCV_677071 [Trichonephila clavipes]|nr:hypothetical protein TNCV_677071 [Trichonephila clavipes]